MKEAHKGVLAEVLEQQEAKDHLLFHVFCDINFNAKTSEELCDSVIVAPAIAEASHASGSKDKISDVQTSRVPSPTVAEAAPVTDEARQFVEGLGVVEKVGRNTSMLKAATVRPA